jgi:hypothetical protein
VHKNWPCFMMWLLQLTTEKNLTWKYWF